MPVTKAAIAPKQGGTPAPTPSQNWPTAARDISGGRVVMLTGDGVDYPLVSMADDGDAVLGISTGAAATGQGVAYQHEGRMTDPSWTWTVGPVYCGGSGVLVQSAPTGRWQRQVADAVPPTVINIHLFPTYYRES